VKSLAVLFAGSLAWPRLRTTTGTEAVQAKVRTPSPGFIRKAVPAAAEAEFRHGGRSRSDGRGRTGTVQVAECRKFEGGLVGGIVGEIVGGIVGGMVGRMQADR